MFIGHFAVALAAKRTSPRVSLGTLFFAVQFLDLLWPVLVLAGIEHFRIEPGNTAVTPLDFYDYPFSHSLLTTAVWSILIGILYWFIRKSAKDSFILALCVSSHWILDFITHRPDLPLMPESTVLLGLGLWNSSILSVAIECLFFVAGSIIYIRSTRPISKSGSVALWCLLAFLLVIYLLNIFGPPPPSIGMVSVSANALWIFILWGYWVDKNRHAVSRTE